MTTQTSSGWIVDERFDDYILWSRRTATNTIYQIVPYFGVDVPPPTYAGYVDKNWLLKVKGLL